MLLGLARNQVLIAEAKRQGFAASKQQQDSLTNVARQQLMGVVRSAGLVGIKPQSGENEEQAVERKVRTLVEAVVKGEQNIIPLGPLAYALREQYSGQVYDRSFPNVVAKVQATRPAAPPQGLQMPNPAPVPTTTPPTTPAAPPARK